MNRSPRKKELKVKKAASRAVNEVRVKKHGYRKLVIGELVFNWRFYEGSYPSPRVEIRPRETSNGWSRYGNCRD